MKNLKRTYELSAGYILQPSLDSGKKQQTEDRNIS